jgi:hypothetical protein
VVSAAAYLPDENVRDVIAAAVASLSTGRSLFAGAARSADDDDGADHLCVFVLATGGAPSRPIKGGPDERNPSVQITIRSNPPGVERAFRDGQTLARAVYEAVDRNPPAGYCECRAVASHPLYIGEDSEGRHEWTINLSLIVDVTA